VGPSVRNLRKSKKTLKSGCGEEDIHKPSLWYFDLLLFTKDQEEPTAGQADFVGCSKNGSSQTEEVCLLVGLLKVSKNI
jgi:hypothetical protein